MKARKQNSTYSLKKSLLGVGPLFAACMLFSTLSYGQVGFTIGPKAGVSFNSFDADGSGNYSARTAWAAGLFANLHLGESFSIQPELLIHEKGATQTVNGQKNEVKLNYFSIPLLAKFMIPIGGIVYPHVLAGPVYNYRLNARYAANDAGDISFNDGDLKRTEMAGAFGGGVDIISNHVFVNIDARYNVGLSDLSKQNVQVRNRNVLIMVGVGYRFGTPK